MRIVTRRDPPPIPRRDFDWSAWDDSTYDGAPDAGACSTIGFGRTEQEAVADLLHQMDFGEPWQREDAREYRNDNGQFGVGS